jgi:hypothetical protein
MMRNQDQGFIDPALAGCGDAASIPLSSDEPHLVNEQFSRVSLKSGYDGYDIARRTWSVTLFLSHIRHTGNNNFTQVASFFAILEADVPCLLRYEEAANHCLAACRNRVFNKMSLRFKAQRRHLASSKIQALKIKLILHHTRQRFPLSLLTRRI